MSRRTTGWIIGSIFFLTMFMATGPGVLLVNRPTTALGLPLLYVWGLSWYLVQVVCVLWAAKAIWARDEDPS